MRCTLLEGKVRSLEIRSDVHDEYNERVDEANLRMAWGASKGEHLVQERVGADHAELAVLAGGVLAAHETGRSRGLHVALSFHPIEAICTP